MRNFFLLFCLLGACQYKRTFDNFELNNKPHARILILNDGMQSDLIQKARQVGASVEGDVILQIEGTAEQISKLKRHRNLDYIIDEVVEKNYSAFEGLNNKTIYLAKEDFNIPNYVLAHPTHDGRNVIVGVVDDGISPHQSGFKLTTTKERKLLKKWSNSSMFELDFIPGQIVEGEIQEERKHMKNTPDMNGDGVQKNFKYKFFEKYCFDIDLNTEFSKEECILDFSSSGDYILLKNGAALVVEKHPTKNKIRLFQPEVKDGHGEGVASVMAASNTESIQDLSGIAPGAKIIDYDLAETSDVFGEYHYSLGDFLLGIEWAAKNGAEVINLSYSLFYSSAEAQLFMRKAISDIVKKYNVVLSFSGGNLGPSLGTLARKMIYPDNVLVAGAFVSQKLDELVWGVTGIPEEGRVIYYSSRGPGPLGDNGPLLISPLSSLTHATPNGGFVGFSGTSSASPALGGFAAVLISALKQEGHKIDASTLVHAMRLSGKMLINEPFVAQGYGVPKIDLAKKAYLDLAAGKEVAVLNVGINIDAIEGQKAKGLSFFKSKMKMEEIVMIELQGAFSSLANIGVTSNTVVPLRIEYPNGVSGSKELWTSLSKSYLHISINPKEILGKKDEAFAEIKIYNQLTQRLMVIIPITVVNDMSLQFSTQQRVLKVSPQSSERFHVNIEEASGFLKIRSKVISGDIKRINLSITDSAYLRQMSALITDEVWVPVSKIGHHQIAISMNGGAKNETEVLLDIEHVKINVSTQFLDSKNPNLQINLTGSSLSGLLQMIPASQVIEKKFSEIGKLTMPLEIKYNLSEKIKLKASIVPSLLSRYSSDNSVCSLNLRTEDGSTTFEPYLINGIWESLDTKSKQATFTCSPFDLGISSGHSLSWQMKIEKIFEPILTKPVGLKMNSTTKVLLEGIPVGKYEVWLKNMIGDENVLIGTIEAF